MAVGQKRLSQLWTGYILACYTLMVESQIAEQERVSIVELTGAGVPHMGNVMVATNGSQGQFRSVCDDDFSMKEANAVCVALGFPRALRFTRRHFFGKKSKRWSPDGWMSLYRLQCPVEGSVGVLEDCQVLVNMQAYCTDDEIAGVECQTDGTDYGCSPNDFICREIPSGASQNSSLCIGHSHLCDGMSDCPDSSDEAEDLCSEEGIIAIFSNLMTELPENTVAGTIATKHNNTWATLCGFGANERVAQVACRSLGYNNGFSLLYYKAYFGKGSVQVPVWGDYDVYCEGHEPTLDQCRRYLESSRCSHVNDAGVFCHDGNFSVQLVGGTTPASGRLEIISSGASSPAAICDAGFDDLDAQVVCRMLGYDSTLSVAHRGSPFGMDSKNIWNIILDCYGNEKSINDCKIKISPIPCNQRQTAAVTCMRANSSEEVLRSLLPADCGIPVHASSRFLTSLGKVRGGKVASRFDIPWLAQLRIRDDGVYRHLCGAVIISEFYLLTAAHCVDNTGRLNLIVSIGNFNNDYDDPTQEDFFIDKIKVHKHFEEMGLDVNDIALIKIDAENGRGIKFGDRVKPVCLPRIGETYGNLSSCQISGWGAQFSNSSSKGPPSVVPRVASIAWTPDIACEIYYGSKAYTSSYVCFGGQDLNITCPGDSGSPLTCLGDQGRHVLYGMSNSGLPCSRFRFPNNYSRVTKYLRWIQEQIIGTNPV